MSLPLPPAPNFSLEAQNTALRAETQQWRAAQAATQTQQARSDERALRQARFYTVFKNSPFRQKIDAQ